MFPSSERAQIKEAGCKRRSLALSLDSTALKAGSRDNSWKRILFHLKQRVAAVSHPASWIPPRVGAEKRLLQKEEAAKKEKKCTRREKKKKQGPKIASCSHGNHQKETARRREDTDVSASNKNAGKVSKRHLFICAPSFAQQAAGACFQHLLAVDTFVQTVKLLYENGLFFLLDREDGREWTFTPSVIINEETERHELLWWSSKRPNQTSEKKHRNCC